MCVHFLQSTSYNSKILINVHHGYFHSITFVNPSLVMLPLLFCETTKTTITTTKNSKAHISHLTSVPKGYLSTGIQPFLLESFIGIWHSKYESELVTDIAEPEINRYQANCYYYNTTSVTCKHLLSLSLTTVL